MKNKVIMKLEVFLKIPKLDILMFPHWLFETLTVTAFYILNQKAEKFEGQFYPLSSKSPKPQTAWMQEKLLSLKCSRQHQSSSFLTTSHAEKRGFSTDISHSKSMLTIHKKAKESLSFSSLF